MQLADLPSPNKQATLSAVTIGQLPSPMLTKIFSYLPLKDRCLLVLVSSIWAETSRIPWTDMTILNLASIPRAMTDPILRLCPKLATIEAEDHVIVLEETPNPPTNENVRTLKLREVIFAGKDLRPLIPSRILIREYFERFPRLRELIVYDCEDATLPPSADSADAQVEGIAAVLAGAKLTILLLERMASPLERLILARSPFHGAPERNVNAASLSQLRELCLVDIGHWPTWLAQAFGGTKFPNLEVLVFASHHYIESDSLTHLITAKSPLRVLVISGKGDMLSRAHRRHDQLQDEGFGHLNEVKYPIVLPARQIVSDSGAANQSRTLPPLQIFVGGDFTKHVRFRLPKAEVANFWRIDCLMPEYLAKPEVAAVFKDVWAMKALREGPGNGLSPWGHPDELDLFFSTEPLFFC